jgi:hypothetical protein
MSEDSKMKSISFLLSPVSSLAARLRRSRPGSVLIIVIVLLLLLAILGAAYISTTRSARVASAQNVLNSDVDDMLNGISKVCEGVIVDDLNDTFGDLRGNTANTTNTTIINRSIYQGQAGAAPAVAPNNVAVATGYNPGDIVNDVTNPFYFYTMPQGSNALGGLAVAAPWAPLTSRLPFTALGTNCWLSDRIPDPAGTGAPLWTAITQSVQGTAGALTSASILGTNFVDPRTGAAIPQASFSGAIIGTPSAAGALTPTYLTLANGFNTPAFQYGTSAAFAAAADADGDGIADSLFFAIPGASYDGLTWYAAVRIIDNNSAINANTAWDRDTLSFLSGGTDTWNLFQASVGLEQILSSSGTTPDSINTVNTYRFNGTPTAAAYDESAITFPPATTPNTPPTGVLRTDYGFISAGEGLYQQLIRRIANPGYITAATRYQPFPLSDEAALAYHFCLQNPNSMSQSVLESVLPISLCGIPGTTSAVPSTPYDPSQTNTPTTGWYPANFAYSTASDAITAPMSLRPLLVTRNPVSNYIQQVYDNNGGTPSNSEPILPNYMLPYGVNTTSGAPNPTHIRGIYNSPAGTAYAVNDVVVYPGPVPWPIGAPTGTYNGPSYTFIAVAPSGGGAQYPANLTNNVLTGVNTAYWKLQPWPSNPVKANVNTASFPELFRAFWSVMAGNPSNSTPFGSTGVDAYNIYDPTAPTAASTTTGNPQAMFRSPLRDPISAGAAYVSLLDAPTASGMVTNTNTMLLRAALAAVDAIGVRDNSQNISSRTITLLKNSQINNGTGGSAAGTAELQVYSNAPQPVISEVYANTFNGPDSNTTTSNLQGYVAVELYNPYSVPLILVNWQLGIINRSTTASTYPNLYFQTNPNASGTPPQTPAGAVSIIGPMQALNDPIEVTGAYPTPKLGTIYLPPHGYVLLENYNGSGVGTPLPTDATCRPLSALNPQTGAGAPGSFRLTAGTAVQTGIWYGPGGIGLQTVCDVYVPNLQLVIQGTMGSSITGASTGGELVLLRPRRFDGVYSAQTAATDPTNVYNEGTYAAPNLWDLVPVDSYDFTGLVMPAAGSPYPVWSYIREKSLTVAKYYFMQFFPGFYDATKVTREGAGTGTDAESIPASGTPQTVTWLTTTGTSAVPAFGVDATLASYVNPFPPIQVSNIAAGNAAGDAMHFPNAVVSAQDPYPAGITPAAGGYLHPLGGFARNGDMLDIPFVGAYRIRISTSTLPSQVNTSNFLELNSLPMDCSLAAIETGTGGAAAADPAENIGRFVPMAASYLYVNAIQTDKAPTGTAFPLPDYYAWTRNLFNYLTVQSSTDAYLPNFDPNIAAINYNAPNNTFAYPPQNTKQIPPTPTLTANAAATDQTLQDSVGVEGLININTASWKVLSMLPFVDTAGSVAANDAADRQIAQNIVNYRLTHGPFTSIFDLNQVPGFQSGTNVAWTPTTAGATPPWGVPAPTVPTPPTSFSGLLSPADPNFGTATAGSNTASGIAEDYQWDCLTLDRISNLITTRSDTFTVYIEVQGWQNVGLANPQPMITRRYAFIVDRSAINGDPNTRFLKTLTVPND